MQKNIKKAKIGKISSDAVIVSAEKRAIAVKGITSSLLAKFKDAAPIVEAPKQEPMASESIMRLAIVNVIDIIQQCKERISKLDGKISKASSKIAEKSKEIKDMDAWISKIDEQYQSSLKSIEDISYDISKENEGIGQLEQKLKEMEGAVEGIRTIQTTINEKMGAKATLQVVKAAFELGKSGAEQLNKNIENLERDITNTKKELKAKNAKKKEMTDAADFEKARAENLKMDINEKEMAKKDIQKDADTLGIEVRELESKKKAENANIAYLTKKSGMDLMQEEMNRIIQAKKDLESKYAEGLELMGQANDHILKREKFIEEMTAENSKLKKDAEAADKTKAELAKEMQELILRIDELGVTANKLKEELEAAKAKGSRNIEQELKDALAAIEDMKKESLRMERTIIEQKEALRARPAVEQAQAMPSASAQPSEELAALRGENEKLRSDNEILKSANEGLQTKVETIWKDKKNDSPKEASSQDSVATSEYMKLLEEHEKAKENVAKLTSAIEQFGKEMDIATESNMFARKGLISEATKKLNDLFWSVKFPPKPREVVVEDVVNPHLEATEEKL